MKSYWVLFLIGLAVWLLIFISPYIGIEPPQTSYTTSIIRGYDEDPFFRYSINTFPIKVEALDADQMVFNDSVKIGVAGQMNEMHFGRLPISASTTKILEIENNEETTAKARIEVYGQMSAFTEAIDAGQLLPPHKKSEIRIKCKPPSAGNYTGELKMVIISPKSSFLEQLLKLM